MKSPDPYFGLMPLLYTAAGFVLGLIPGWFARKRRLRTHWSALRAEANQCFDLATTYVADGVMAPLYRLPTMAYEKSFSVLLADGAVGEEDVQRIAVFYGDVGQLNRGLDRIADMNDAKDRAREYKRNLIKAHNIVDIDGNGKSPHDRIVDLLTAKIDHPWWKFYRNK